MGTSKQFVAEIEKDHFQKLKIGSAKFVTYVRSDYPGDRSKVVRTEDLVGL